MTHAEQILRWEEWTNLHGQGMSFAEIGRRYGVSYQVVSIRLKKGIPKKREVSAEYAGVEKWRLSGRERVRYLVRLRDEFTCQECDRKWTPGERMFDVHHLRGLCGKKSKGYDKMKERCQLITLCHKCHFARHDHSSRL